MPVGHVAILSHEISSNSLRVTFSVSGVACNLYLATAEPVCSGGYSIGVPAAACSFSPIASATGASPNTLSVYASDAYYGFGKFVFLEVAGASAIAGSNCTLTYEYGRAATADLDPRIVAAVTVPTVIIGIAVFVGYAVYRQRKRRRDALVAAAEEAANDGGMDDDEGDGGDGGAVHRQLVYSATQPMSGGVSANASQSGGSGAPGGSAQAGVSHTAKVSARSHAANEDPT